MTAPLDVQGNAAEAQPEAVLAGVEAKAIEGRSLGQIAWMRLKRDKVALGSGVFILFLLAVAILAGPITKLYGHDPFIFNSNLIDPNLGTPKGAFGGASTSHWFGVEPINGRDILARIIYGARISMIIAFLATGVSVIIGSIAGMAAGYFGGWIDSLLSRIMDLLLAFPLLLFAIALVAVLGDYSAPGLSPDNTRVALLVVIIGTVVGMAAGFFGGWVDSLLSRIMDLLLAFPLLLFAIALVAVLGDYSAPLMSPDTTRIALLVVIIGFFNWPYIGRIIRGQTLSLREKEYVEAARSLGAGNGRILFRELLPNLVGPILVYSTLIIPTNILFEAALSFLGVGVRIPNPSWGGMLSDAAQGYFQIDPMFMVVPGVALFVTVMAFNLFGDGLRDALDPRSER